MKIANIIIILSLIVLPAFSMAAPPKKFVVVQKHDQGLHLGHHKNKKKIVVIKEQRKPASSIQVKINL